MSDIILKKEERIAFALRSLYRKYGYLSYKMSKFEEYDLYVQNKDFLVGDGVIAFNDTNGKLLALKPDVTLSIIKNDMDSVGKRKVCYNENVYRISAKTKQFKEIMQVGLECIGDVDIYDVFETVYLAAGSLASVSQKFVLDISHLGILSAVLNDIALGEAFNREVMKKIAEKNVHELSSLCEKYNVSAADTARLITVVEAYGDMRVALAKLATVCEKGAAATAYAQLKTLCELLSATEYADNIRVDFSVVNDMNYYDDIVFKGFIDGIGEGVLSGGRYDKLLSKMGRKSGGIGFAVYLDLFESFGEEKQDFDVDVLVLYDEKTVTEKVISTVRATTEIGKTVRAQKSAGTLRYKELLDIRGDEK